MNSPNRSVGLVTFDRSDGQCSNPSLSLSKVRQVQILFKFCWHFPKNLNFYPNRNEKFRPKSQIVSELDSGADSGPHEYSGLYIQES